MSPNTGATNHMKGSRPAFSELNSVIRGMVKFGDGSVVEIEGRSAILFIGKEGEHRKLTGVYFIPSDMNQETSIIQYASMKM